MQFKDIVSLIRKEGGNVKIIAEETFLQSYQRMLVEENRQVPCEQYRLFEQRLCRLNKGEPVQYIIGKWEFYGREFLVGKGVLIPREDTQAVVDLALDFLKDKQAAVFADLGSGSGCIAVTLNKQSGAKGYSVERSDEAFSYLEKNIKRHSAEVSTVLGDMFEKSVLDSLPELDLVVSNPPYITKEEMTQLDREVLKEPKEALFGGDDGLYFYRKICQMYFPKIKKGGMLCFEVGYRQADAVKEILQNAGFHSVKIRKDINGIKRALCALK